MAAIWRKKPSAPQSQPESAPASVAPIPQPATAEANAIGHPRLIPSSRRDTIVIAKARITAKMTATTFSRRLTVTASVRPPVLHGTERRPRPSLGTPKCDGLVRAVGGDVDPIRFGRRPS